MRRRFAAVVVTVVAATTVALAASPATAGDDDEAIAKKAVLRASDLPDGWEADESADPDEDDPAEGRVPECEDIEAAIDKGDRTPHADSPQFDDGDDPNGIAAVSSEVFVFPKAKGAKRYLAPFKADAAADCLLGRAEVIPNILDAELVDLDVAGAGTDGVGYSVLLTLDNEGVPFTFAVDVVVVRVGRGIVTFAAENADEPLPIGPDLLRAVTGRLEEAL
jgi:hypothetical protein